MSTTPTPLTKDELTGRLRAFLKDRGTAYALADIGYFGSYARGEAAAESDVDIVYRMEPSAKPTLFDLAQLRDELVELLGHDVDLIEFRERLPERLRERIRREAVYVR